MRQNSGESPVNQDELCGPDRLKAVSMAQTHGFPCYALLRTLMAATAKLFGFRIAQILAHSAQT